jgi:hypothetical protein
MMIDTIGAFILCLLDIFWSIEREKERRVREIEDTAKRGQKYGLMLRSNRDMTLYYRILHVP